MFNLIRQREVFFKKIEGSKTNLAFLATKQ